MSLMLRNNRVFSDFPSIFDEVFDTMWPDTNGKRPQMNTPAVNVKEEDDKFALEVAAPGMKKDDFKIELENNTLVISSEKKHEDEQKEENFTRREFGYYNFSRSFNLPDDLIDVDKIKARYKEGILHIDLPKQKEKARKLSRMIDIS